MSKELQVQVTYRTDGPEHPQNGFTVCEEDAERYENFATASRTVKSKCKEEHKEEDGEHFVTFTYTFKTLAGKVRFLTIAAGADEE